MTIHLPAGTFDGTREPTPRPGPGRPVQGDHRRRIEPAVLVDLVPGDTATVQAVFAGLSPHSRYRRFQTSRPVLPAATLRRLAAVQPGRHVVHAALLAGRPVGLVRWIRWGADRSAELAYEVVDAAQRQGIGRALLRRAAGSATADGIEFFLAQLSGEDDALHRRVRRWGGRPDATRPGLYRVPVAPVAAGPQSRPADRPHVVA